MTLVPTLHSLNRAVDGAGLGLLVGGTLTSTPPIRVGVNFVASPPEFRS